MTQNAMQMKPNARWEPGGQAHPRPGAARTSALLLALCAALGLTGCLLDKVPNPKAAHGEQT